MTDEQEWEELPLEGYPGEILKVRATTRWERAAEARYELKGKRITGLIRIEVERYQRDLFSFESVHLKYGDKGAYNPWRSGYYERIDPPTFNGASVSAAGVVQRIDRLTDPGLDAWSLNARHSYPQRAGQRFAATVRTVMQHYLARPDLDKIRHVAAAHHSVWLHDAITTEMNRLHERIEESTSRYTELAEELLAVQELYDRADTVSYDLGIKKEAQDA